MKNLLQLSLSLVCAFCVLAVLSSPKAEAQEYFVIDQDLGLYCVYLPGSTTVATLPKRGDGLVLSDFPTERDKLERLIQQTTKRIKTLSRLAERNRLTNREVGTIRRLIQAILNQRLRGNARKVRRALKSKIRQANQVRLGYEALRTELQLCEDRNLDVTAAGFGADIQYLEFPFTHPDFGVTYRMFGLALTTTLNRKAVRQGGGAVCVSSGSSQPGGALRASFPSESSIFFGTDLCSQFFFAGQFFRSPLNCKNTSVGFAPNTGVAWLDVSITAGVAPTSSSVFQLEQKLRKTGSVFGRAPSRKRPCRVG